MSGLRVCIVGCAALLLGACQIVPPQRPAPTLHDFGSLPDGAIAPASSSPMPAIALSVRLDLPDTSTSILRRAAAGEAVDRFPDDRWAAPLDQLIEARLTALARRQSSLHVLLPGDPTPPDAALGVVVSTFEVDGGEVRTALDADLTPGPGQPITVDCTRAVAQDIDAVVAAFTFCADQMLTELLQRIAAAVQPGNPR